MDADKPRIIMRAGLAPFASDTESLQAGRLMLQELARYFATRNGSKNYEQSSDRSGP